MRNKTFATKCHSELVSEFQKQEMLNQIQHDRNKAFTLAEVLITLTIIGVIAALTIPNLMQKWQDHAEITAAKKAYSVLDNAIKMAITENGPMEDWGWPDVEDYGTNNSVFFAEKISPYLRVKKICKKDYQCFRYGFKSNGDKYTGGNDSYFKTPAKNIFRYWNSSGTGLILQDGSRIKIPKINAFHVDQGPNKDVLYDTIIAVDINGSKGPNIAGHDIFEFGLTYKGLSPYACTFWSARQKSGCSLTADNQWNGCSCYYWIWKHNNMDYKYRDVSAEW